MKTTQPFSYPVTEAGLPRDWCTIRPTGNENLFNLTSQEIATTFWLLDCIHIDFAYSINNNSHSRSATLCSHVPPYLRIAQDPIFQYHFHNPNDLECYIALELWSIAQPIPFNGTLHLRFSLFERDQNQLYILTCDTIAGYRLLDQKTFTLLNRLLPLHLYTLSSQWTGHIQNFTLTTEYHALTT